MSIEGRVEKLEKQTGVGKQPYIIWVLYEGQPKPTEGQKETAIADYKTKHPDWETHPIIVLYIEPEAKSTG